jgi:hypothetical protein
MTDAPEAWKPLVITSRSLTAPSKGRVIITLQLSEPPTHEWVQAFDHAPWVREGSTAFVEGDLPRIRSDTIEWDVPVVDLLAALKSIRGTMRYLNTAFPRILHDIQRAQSEQAAREVIALEHHAELQRWLDEFEF